MTEISAGTLFRGSPGAFFVWGKMRTIIDFLKNVYKDNGYIGVLITIAVIVALVLAVSYFSGIGVADIAKWIGMIN